MQRKSAVLGMAAAGVISAVSFSALAGPTVPACSAANLSTYLSGGTNATCTVLDKTLSGVTFSNNASQPASDVNVDPLLVTNDPGLSFGFSFRAQNVSGSISYTITAPSSDPMTDASLGLLGTTPPGSLSDTETLSNGKTLSASDSMPNASTTFAMTTSLAVTDAFSENNGATLAFIGNQFSETPVPVPVPKPSPLASLALLGIGLSALGLAERRKRT
jgi:hypothetical protein